MCLKATIFQFHMEFAQRLWRCCFHIISIIDRIKSKIGINNPIYFYEIDAILFLASPSDPFKHLVKCFIVKCHAVAEPIVCIIALWNLTADYAAVLPKHLSNIRAIRQLWLGFQALGYLIHYTDVIMTTVASQNHQPHGCSLNRLFRRRQRKHQSSTSLAFVWGIHRDRWIPRTKDQLCGKCSIWWRHHGSLSNPLIASRCDLDSILKCWVCHIMAITLHVVGIPYGDISDNISYYGQVLFPNRNHTGLPSCKRYSKCWHDY